MFYRFLKITLGTGIIFFFKRIATLGIKNIPSDKPVLLVSNHPSAFMDPLILGHVLYKPLYFFARADIFKPGFSTWIMHQAHMSPIYRIIDGAGSLEKNDMVFSSAYDLLSKNKSLLLFGEGFTDEEFIRRVKPMKKGSMRIALGAEDKFDFKLGVQIICVGINYSHPHKFRSDVLVSFSKPIEVSKYKDAFLEHNNKAMQELNKEIYSSLKNQAIHIENTEFAELFEHLLILSNKGINNDFYDASIPLTERWKFSKQFSDAFNKLEKENPSEIETLKSKCSEYFENLSKLKLSNESLTENQNSSFLDYLFLVLTFPAFIIGMINNYLPVKLSSIFSKMVSKRPVFWRSTDMVFFLLTAPLYYYIVIKTLSHFTYQYYSQNLRLVLLLTYLLLMPFTGIFSYNYIQKYNFLLEKIKGKRIIKENKSEIENLTQLRNSILEKITRILSSD